MTTLTDADTETRLRALAMYVVHHYPSAGQADRFLICKALLRLLEALLRNCGAVSLLVHLTKHTVIQALVEEASIVPQVLLLLSVTLDSSR